MVFSYLERGFSKENPLIFLHGFLGSKEDFLPLIGELKGDFWCLAIDLPGHGGTPLFADGERLWEVTMKKLIAFLDEREIQKASFLGYSMGGRILLRFAEKYEERVDQMFILSAHLGGVQGEEERWVELLKGGDIDQFLIKWYAQPLFANFKITKEVLERRRKNDPKKLLEVLSGFSLSRQQKSEARKGIWFFCGEDDFKYRALYEEISAKKVILGAGHPIHLEKPLEVGRQIKEIWREKENECY
jgi:2-succinyl-6-hydroxy-2,4-cyclohexadiene-1-carboxylate synthase